MIVMMVMLMVVIILVIVVMMMVVMLMRIPVFVIVIMMMVAAAFVLVIPIVMMVVMMLGLQLLEQSVALLHGLEDLCAGQLVPGGGDDDGVGILLPQQGHAGVELLLGDAAGAAQNDGPGGLHLVVVEFAEVLHIHLALARVGHGDQVAERHRITGDLLHGCLHVAELAHTGGLNEDPVRRVVGNDLGQSLAEVAHQAAADAAGVHLGDLDARVLQKAAVNADLAELVLDQHQLLSGVGFLNHLFDQGRLACAEKTGVNVNFCHR